MKNTHHEILKYVYKHEEAGIREICSMLDRKYGDHRDFHGLVALLESGYLRFTGPYEVEKNGKSTSYLQACCFQAYSQGEGDQTYKDITLIPTSDDQYLYIGPKSIEYFDNKKRSFNALLFTGLLAILTSIISGIVVSKMTVTAVQVVDQFEVTAKEQEQTAKTSP